MSWSLIVLLVVWVRDGLLKGLFGINRGAVAATFVAESRATSEVQNLPGPLLFLKKRRRCNRTAQNPSTLCCSLCDVCRDCHPTSWGSWQKDTTASLTCPSSVLLRHLFINGSSLMASSLSFDDPECETLKHCCPSSALCRTKGQKTWQSLWQSMQVEKTILKMRLSRSPGAKNGTWQWDLRRCGCLGSKIRDKAIAWNWISAVLVRVGYFCIDSCGWI